MDITVTGLEGLYNLTFEPTPVTTCALTSSVQYTVEIVNLCPTATISIDPTNLVFKLPETNSAMHIFLQS